MGKVIGRQGKIAKAIRTVARAVGQKPGERYTIDILEPDEKGGTKVAVEDCGGEDVIVQSEEA